MLTLMKGIGPITANRLIRRFGGLDNIFELSDKDILNYMLNNYDAKQFKRIYIALGYTDLCKGIDGLANHFRNGI